MNDLILVHHLQIVVKLEGSEVERLREGKGRPIWGTRWHREDLWRRFLWQGREASRGHWGQRGFGIRRILIRRRRLKLRRLSRWSKNHLQHLHLVHRCRNALESWGLLQKVIPSQSLLVQWFGQLQWFARLHLYHQNLHVRRSVQVADSVQLFAVGQEHWKTRINSFPIRSGTERVVAVDWHQVTDTCRFGERSAARISEEYRLPDRVLQFYRQVAAIKQPGDLLVVCSHIHQSEYNLNNLLWAVQVNNLPIDIVIVTAERIGRAGTLFTLAALTPYSSKVLLLDDNYEISQEWLAHRERFVDIRFCHIKVPRKPKVSDWPSAWNVLDHWDEVRGFLTEGRWAVQQCEIISRSLVHLLHWLGRLAAVDSASSWSLLSDFVQLLSVSLRFHFARFSDFIHQSFVLCVFCLNSWNQIDLVGCVAPRVWSDGVILWISSSIKTSHLHQTSIILSSVTFTFVFCRTVELHHHWFPSAFCFD